MSKRIEMPADTPFIAVELWLRALIREELEAFMDAKSSTEFLLTPEELAARLKVPLSWVYEQSRQGKIPTHRIGRYIRFDLAEVIASQKALKNTI